MDPLLPPPTLFERIQDRARRISYRLWAILLVCFVFIIGVVYPVLFKAPSTFPVGQIVTVSSGESLQSLTMTLSKNGAIRSPLVFRTAVILFGGEKRVRTGDYLLSPAEGPLVLAYRFATGHYGLEPVKLTIPEGWNVFQIRDFLKTKLVHFDEAAFMQAVKNKEGYLFPDTYFVSPVITPETLVMMMRANFDARVEPIPEIKTFNKTLSQVIIMASILEEEARTTESRRMVADILWRRLAAGMPLQVDSTFSYINGKTSEELTASDLRIDSPYNTYRYKGLPPTPIANPGLDSIRAAVTPIPNKYVYFLSDKKGEMHYAVTFEEHQKNVAKYLK